MFPSKDDLIRQHAKAHKQEVDNLIGKVQDAMKTSTKFPISVDFGKCSNSAMLEVQRRLNEAGYTVQVPALSPSGNTVVSIN